MKTLSEKVARFRALHAAPGIFVIPNPWDAGSARLLAGVGYSALATSSSASAGTLGRRDGKVFRDEALAMAQRIVDAVEIPVAADLENGFGEKPDDAAETIRRAADVGLAGGSIEDAPHSGQPYALSLAVERVQAAVEAARKAPAGFVLTARTENFVRGKLDLDDTIKRLRAFEQAGADVLFAPGLPDLESVRAVCAAVAKPVNFMNGLKGKSFPIAELKAAGVKRISVAASLYRIAMTALRDAAVEIRDTGTFGYVEHAMPSPELYQYFPE